MQKLKGLVIAATLLLTGCATSGNTDTSTLQNLQQLSQNSVVSADSKGINSIRQMALQETALSVGAQAGLAWRAKIINSGLDSNAMNLARIFNFNLMMMDHNVLPPVLEEGDNSLNLDNDQTIRIVDRTYQIINQAKFVTTPPTWRDYLWLNYTKPPAPDATLLPKNEQEKEIWQKYVTMGWQNGINQADTIYVANLARLKRDFTGMIRYRTLLAQHIVSAPFVAKANLGITGDGSNMQVNDQILRITALPQLQTNSKVWKPIAH